MEYNQPSEIVKDLSFGAEAQDKIAAGVHKLAEAVKSTLGASGKCVIYEDAMGKPVITKDGVTVAESVVLYDPVENIGATLIKEAAKNTVKEAGDGTTTATVLADSLLKNAYEKLENNNIREIKAGIESGGKKVEKYLDKIKKEVKGDMLRHVATISTNNDAKLGEIISSAYEAVGKHGVVLMEESGDESTYFDLVDGVQFDSGLKSQNFATDEDRVKSELDKPYVLIVASPIPNIRKIQSVLEHVIKNNSSILIVASVEQQPYQVLMTNKLKGNLKVNVVDLPGFGAGKRDAIDDLAILTGAKVIDESLGDDMDLIDASFLGRAVKSITDSKNTILTIDEIPEEAKERIDLVEKKIKEEKNPYIKTKLEQRLAMLSGAVAVIKVGGSSKIELKEKKDRVEDAIYAVKAALQEGIVPGGGVALMNAARTLEFNDLGEFIFAKSILAPFNTILENASIEVPDDFDYKKGWGIDVVTGKPVDMVKAGIIDPVLVTKTALKNAISVVNTIISADCVISNKRISQ
jgi:chaperonin GroEL